MSMGDAGDTGPFAMGERVLVPHTDSKYYEARIQKAEYR